jgi:hypothetical protein
MRQHEERNGVAFRISEHGRSDLPVGGEVVPQGLHEAAALARSRCWLNDRNGDATVNSEHERGGQQPLHKSHCPVAKFNEGDAIKEHGNDEFSLG